MTNPETKPINPEISTINLIRHEQVTEKPWGREIIHTPEGSRYTLKTIEIQKGKKLSLQSHDEKEETFILKEGEANLHLGPIGQINLEQVRVFKMQIGESYTIPVNTVHRLEGVTECKIMEASTPETGNTFRYQDDYNRPTETEEMRKLPNRGWNPNQ